jgi:pSer/pThr/pTyr-binding forkhead associated (FHA) protein
MVQLQVLSGKKAGAEMVARRFPLSVGRAADCDLSLGEPGVWEKHFVITLDSTDGFILTSDPNATVIVDGNVTQRIALRSGNVIEIGLAKILFGLSPTRQKSLVLRECLTWVALAGLCLAQVALIYKLAR